MFGKKAHTIWFSKICFYFVDLSFAFFFTKKIKQGDETFHTNTIRKPRQKCKKKQKTKAPSVTTSSTASGSNGGTSIVCDESETATSDQTAYNQGFVCVFFLCVSKAKIQNKTKQNKTWKIKKTHI